MCECVRVCVCARVCVRVRVRVRVHSASDEMSMSAVTQMNV